VQVVVKRRGHVLWNSAVRTVNGRSLGRWAHRLVAGVAQRAWPAWLAAFACYGAIPGAA